jgi:3-dehydroquinate synthase
VLNYGHTLAHAIERAESYAVRHGEAVAVGCVFVAELARLASGLPAEVVDRHRRVLARVGLPTTYAGADFDTLLAAMRVDKKTRGSQLRFVVLRDLADPAILAGPAEEQLRAAYALVNGGTR